MKITNQDDTDTSNWEEFDYFERRVPGKIYVSKVFDSKLSPLNPVKLEKRFIQKVIDKKHYQFEKLNILGHIVLRESETKRDQIKALVYGNEPNLLQLILQRFRTDTGNPYKADAFSFRQSEFMELLEFLRDIKFLDLSNKEKFSIYQSDIGTKKVLVDIADKELINIIKDYKGEKREKFLNLLKNQNITKEDLDILSGRKSGLDEFKTTLNENFDWPESKWQSFFEKNTWIFGYGLDYKFLRILRRESHISGVDLNGKNDVISDFLIADKNFTIIVELKKPNTQLFENEQNRSESWRLSRELTYSVSQILAQKAEWQLKSENENFDKHGNPINQRTVDPKTILIIGHSNQFSGDTKISKIKAKTFELYRRNMKNIEIYTYDDLLDRARFIVEHNSNLVQDNAPDDDLPF
jgi:hypothetical protein